MIDSQPGPEPQRAIIQHALEIQEAKINARAHNVSPTAFDAEHLRTGPILINGVPHLPAAPPREWLSNAAALATSRWFNAVLPDDQQGRLRAVQGLALLDEALGLLAFPRTGDRVESTRDFLREQRDTIASAIAAYDAFIGELGQELVAKIVAGRAELAEAQKAVFDAGRATVLEKRQALDLAEAGGRELDLEIQAAIDAMAFPTLPNAASFADAKGATSDLERLPAKRPTAVHVRDAIEHGMRGGAQAPYWIIYETNADHELVKWRWRGYAEGHVGT